MVCGKLYDAQVDWLVRVAHKAARYLQDLIVTHLGSKVFTAVSIVDSRDSRVKTSSFKP